MRALITGGAGFIGSHLSEYLLIHGWEVQVIDDFSTGSLENIAPIISHPRFNLVTNTAMNEPLMADMIDKADCVFHCAAAVGVRLIVDQPIRTIKTNIGLCEVVLELCARKGTPVLITSTSEVYGKSSQEKFNEEADLILGPTSKSRWCYAASKIVDEFLAKAYFLQKNLPVVIVRLFNTIGPRQTGQYGMVVPRFIRQALANQSITIYGDGTQCRSFTWVEDVVKAMVAVIQTPEAIGETVNLGHTQETSICDLAVLVRELVGSRSPLVFMSYDEAFPSGFEDMQRRLPDISRAEELIGYTPSLNLRDMLIRIIDHERRS